MGEFSLVIQSDLIYDLKRSPLLPCGGCILGRQSEVRRPIRSPLVVQTRDNGSFTREVIGRWVKGSYWIGVWEV